jgi:diaminopimelate decarboxylase
MLVAMRSLVDGFDVASGGELAKAMAAGMPAVEISFAGPGKRDSELEAAIRAGATLNLESAGEGRRALEIGERLGERPRLAVRVNPTFDLKGSGMRMGGGAKPFGIDDAEVPALVRELIAAGADWRGFHIFAGSQALDAAAIAETQAATVALAAALADAIGEAPPLVNLGGGLGVTYFPGDAPVDIDHVGSELAAVLASRPDSLAGSRFAMELGRYLVADCGVYLCRIVDRKISHGEVFLVTDGGLHHQLAASGNFGTVIRRNYPIAIANRFGAEATEVQHVVGCLCTPLDRLGDQVMLPRGEVGDLVAIFLAGAYGASASPAAFLGHPAALEMLLPGRG